MEWTTEWPSVEWTRETKSWDQVLERIYEKIEPVPESGCWIWLGATKGEEEYGRIYIGKQRFTLHKLMYELLVGPVPDGLVLDHLCRVRCCINPYHLEPVTDAVNIYRGKAPGIIRMGSAHCVKGHPWDGKNTRVHGERRFCRSCERERSTRRRHAMDKR